MEEFIFGRPSVMTLSVSVEDAADDLAIFVASDVRICR